MRVLVTGGRAYFNPGKVKETLDGLRRDRGMNLLMHGMATGADASARSWADRHGVDQVMFPANWRGHGNAAGPYRNALMLEVGQPDLVVAFPGGRGTANMVRQAEEAGIEVLVIADEANQSPDLANTPTSRVGL